MWIFAYGDRYARLRARESVASVVIVSLLWLLYIFYDLRETFCRKSSLESLSDIKLLFPEGVHLYIITVFTKKTSTPTGKSNLKSLKGDSHTICFANSVGGNFL